MTETPTEAPIVLRADITRDELKAVKVLALSLDMTVQAFVAAVIRERLAA